MSDATDDLRLLVTADATLAERVRALSDAGRPAATIHAVTCLRAALRVLDDATPTCILLDLELPDASDLRALQRLQLSATEIPVVVITAVDDPETVARALRAGAQDVLSVEDLTSEALEHAIEYAVHRNAAYEALVASNQQLASFSAMVAHDLRSPLSVTTGMLQLIQRQAEGELSPEMDELLGRGLVATQRATDLIGALLMYAQAKRPDERREPVDLDDAVRWAVEGILEPSLVVDIGRLPIVTASVGAMRQVFQNVISNAVKYADPDHQIHVTITAIEDGDDWQIAVIDNGPGIPPEHREAVFVEGERLGRHDDGFGLGLPAVRATIEQYGGRVWIEAPVDGTGTAVVFTFPRD